MVHLVIWSLHLINQLPDDHDPMTNAGTDMDLIESRSPPRREALEEAVGRGQGSGQGKTAGRGH
jgi:hypothetical protein